MKKAKKIVALLLCTVLLVGATIAGTLAYLTHQTGTVQNTFTVGKVNLGEAGSGLDEAKVNEYGEKLDASGNVWQEGATLAARVMTNTYKLIPGHNYVKDPTIHIQEESEPCYLFVKVDNGIANIETGTTIAQQMAAKGWVVLPGFDGYYYLNTTTAKTAKGETVDYPVFGEFTISADADVSTYATAKIEVTAYAVQADGFADAAAAWAATFGKPANP